MNILSVSENKLSARVRHFRELQGMTQPELSIKAGLNAGYISKMETEQPGYSNPKADILFKIAEALKIDVTTLFKGVFHLEEIQLRELLQKSTPSYRNRRGLSLEELAEKSGLTVPYLEGLESGDPVEVDSTTVSKLAKAFEVGNFTLLFRAPSVNIEGKDKNLSNNYLELIENFQRIPLLTGNVSAKDFDLSSQERGQEMIFLPIEGPVEGLIAWRVKGRAMEPDIIDGDTLVIDRGSETMDGDKVVLEADSLVSVYDLLVFGDESQEMRPLNPKLRTLRFEEGIKPQVLGVVTQVVRNMRRKKRH